MTHHAPEILRQVVAFAIAFCVMTVLFPILGRFWAGVPSQKIVRKGFRTDCVYWVATPIFAKVILPVILVIALAPLVYGLGLHYATLTHGHGPLARQPLWLQTVEIFVLGDFLNYWQHRFFHGRTLWRFHAVHHSSSELDWMSANRLHPVNDFGIKIVQAVPLVLLGFNLTGFVFYIPITGFYAFLLHANLNWDYGPFRAVIASPVFHRWHHTKAAEGLDKNFGGLFPVWDILFGTYYMPRRQPTVFGIDEPMPETYLGQLAAPFRSRAGAPAVETPGDVLSP